MSEINFHTDVQSVFAHYLSVLDGSYAGINRWLHNEGFKSARDGSDFFFVSPETMRSYIRSGYVVPGIEVPRGKRNVPRRRMIWAEEGELDIDSALNGDDYPFRNFAKRDRLPGLLINVEIGFRAISSPDVLADYAAWISRLMYGLENRGYKMDVNCLSRAQIRGRAVNLFIRCQTAGKRTDFKAWSAMLSPGGHRHLIFAARGMAGDAHDVDLGGVGGSMFNGWRVAYDRKSRELTIGCDSHAMHFPTAEMDAEMTEIIREHLS